MGVFIVSENFPKWVFENYPLGQIQDMVTILKEMERNGCTVAELLGYADQWFKDLRNGHQDQLNRMKKIRDDVRMGSRRCPECGNFLKLVEVNDRPCSQVDPKYRSLWFCMDGMNCGYELYSELPYEKELAQQVKELPPGGFKNDMKRRLKRASMRLVPRSLRMERRRSRHKAQAAAARPNGGCGK